MRAGKRNETCRKAGNSESSLSDLEREGRKSLLQREKAGELVILVSDKSGERVVMETQLYTDEMKKHTEGDEVSTREQVNLAEKHLNGAAAQMVRTFNFGEEWQFASWAHCNKVPSLGGLVKTHKAELKMRPV